MTLHTCSEVISWSRNLENESANFYKDLSQKCANNKDVFLTFAKDNEKNIVQIERSYYGVITDAIEGCFAFNIDTDAYELETTLPNKAGCDASLSKAIEIEEKVAKFYSHAARQSKSLMADVPRIFVMVAKKREGRIQILRSLLKKYS